MTLLVRDEADIVSQNIEFHLERGVDFIIATDNGSVDGTRDILADYERRGAVTVIDEPGRDYSQWKWVTRMALMARDEYGADWVMNNDADEFWLNAEGHLKSSLTSKNTQIFLCRRLNFLNSYDDGSTAPWHDRLIYRVKSPTPVPILADFYTDKLPCPYFYLDLPPKAMIRGSGLKAIHQGNHSAQFEGEPVTSDSDIVIYHFPVRSLDQFASKIMQGGEAYARNKDLPVNAGWHWRRWHRKMLADGVMSAYSEALPSTRQLNEDVASGALIEDRSIEKALQLVRSTPESIKA